MPLAMSFWIIYLDLMSIFSASSLMVTPSVIVIGLKSSGEAGGRGSSKALDVLSWTSGLPVFFLLINLEGIGGRGAMPV